MKKANKKVAPTCLPTTGDSNGRGPALMGDYDAKAENIIQLVDRLRDEGAAYDIDLPTVVFCGNQSAGKSSLIEAISGITLPRSDGTCTRCPMELRLDSLSGVWNCTVTLQFKYDKNGNRLNQPKEFQFFENMTENKMVELTVRRAQKAILNPSTDSSAYRKYEFDDKSSASRLKDANNNELKFTKNTVCIKISGAQTNLTLIDLPGIIRTTESSIESGSITMVEGMVKEHINNPRALIIATISCKDEIENQAIIGLAKESDPDGLRTIGVLTKPDTIEENCHDSWFQILNNKRYKLNLGYFIVKNPNKQELDENISFGDARKKEKDFFNTVKPWAKSKYEARSRMGVNNLRDALSSRLTELIEASLPSMRTKVGELLELATKELQVIPPPINKQPNIELLERIKEYVILISMNTGARGADNKLYRAINEHFINLSKVLKESNPKLLLPSPQGNNSSSASAKSEDCEYIVFEKKAGEKSNSHFTKKDLTDILDQQKGREFLHFIKCEALHLVVSKCQSNWGEEAENCLNNVEMELKKLISALSKQVFGRFQGLSKRVELKTDELLTELRDKCSIMIRSILSMELDYPATWDVKYFDTVLQSIHKKLELPLNGSKLETFKNTSKSYIEECLTKLSYIGIRTDEDSLPSLIPNLFDEKVRSIIEMSQAYYKIALRRYCDIIPMVIYQSLVNELAKRLEGHLIEELGVLNENSISIKDLVRENPNVISKRDECSARIKRLREVRKNILG